MPPRALYPSLGALPPAHGVSWWAVLTATRCLAVLAALASACTLVTSTSGLQGGCPDCADAAPAGDASADAPDAARPPDGDAAPADAGRRCSVDDPFDVVARDDVLSETTDDSTAFLSSDELRAYVTHADGLTVHSRASLGGEFDARRKLLSGALPTTVSLSDDELELFYWSYGEQKIRSSKRTSLAADFAPGPAVAALNPLVESVDPFPVPGGGAALYFAASGTDGGASYRIYRSARDQGAFAPPSKVDLGDYYTVSPVVTDDELVLYFGSNRPGSVGANDVFVATRARATDAFGPPRRVGELSSSRDEYPRWLSRDRCRLYFARDTANASNDVFVAKRSPR